MVEVTVGVDHGVEWFGAPAAKRVDDRGALGFDTGIEDHHARTGGNGHRVAERLDDGDVFGEVAELFGDAIDGLFKNARVNDPCRQVDGVFAH